jgi:hypothetical protein
VVDETLLSELHLPAMEQLIKMGVVKAMFPVHDTKRGGVRSRLFREWIAVPGSLFKPQPLLVIRDYFGEKVRRGC